MNEEKKNKVIDEKVSVGEGVENGEERMNFDGNIVALKAFLAMQAEFKVVPKAREAYNFKYAPYEKIAEVCFPTMWKHGFSIMHASVVTHEGSAVVTTLTHAESGMKWESRYAYEAKAKDQERGKSLTYGKRYNTALLLGISIEGEPDRDDDAPTGSGAKAPF